MSNIEQIKVYLKKILQKPTNQSLLEVYPRLRELHHIIDNYHTREELLAVLVEIEDDIMKRREKLGLHATLVLTLATKLVRIVYHESLLFAEEILKEGRFSNRRLAPTNLRLMTLNEPPPLKLEEIFQKRLQTQRILEINLHEIQDPLHPEWTVIDIKAAFLSYVVQNTLSILGWQTAYRAKAKEVEPEKQAAADILTLIKSTILETNWGIQVGGIKLRWQTISKTMGQILSVIHGEGSYAKLSANEKLMKIRDLAVQAEGRYCFTRTDTVQRFYQDIRVAVAAY